MAESDYQYKILNAELIPSVIDAARAGHMESRFGKYEMPEAALFESLEDYLHDPTKLAMVVLFQGKVVAFIFAHTERGFAAAIRMAFDDIIYVAPEHRGLGIGRLLIRIYITWCLDQGIESINLTAGSGISPSTTEQLFLSEGFKPVAVTFEYDQERV